MNVYFSEAGQQKILLELSPTRCVLLSEALFVWTWITMAQAELQRPPLEEQTSDLTLHTGTNVTVG